MSGWRCDIANLPPQRGDFNDELSYQEAYDQWAYDVTQDLNNATTGTASATEDSQGRVVINDTPVGYRFRYLDTVYGSSETGANLSQTISGLPINTSPIYQGVRNSVDASSSSNPADFIWRQVNNTMNSQDVIAGYRLIGGRDIDWRFGSTLPSGYTEDTGSPIDLENFAAGEQGPEGDAALTVLVSTRSGTVFRNQAGPSKVITARVFDGANGEVLDRDITSIIRFKWTRSNADDISPIDVYLADSTIHVQPRTTTNTRIADGIDPQGSRPGAGTVNTNAIIVGEEDVDTSETFFCEVEYNL